MSSPLPLPPAEYALSESITRHVFTTLQFLPPADRVAILRHLVRALEANVGLPLGTHPEAHPPT